MLYRPCKCIFRGKPNLGYTGIIYKLFGGIGGEIMGPYHEIIKEVDENTFYVFYNLSLSTTVINSVKKVYLLSTSQINKLTFTETPPTTWSHYNDWNGEQQKYERYHDLIPELLDTYKSTDNQTVYYYVLDLTSLVGKSISLSPLSNSNYTYYIFYDDLDLDLFVRYYCRRCSRNLTAPGKYSLEWNTTEALPYWAIYSDYDYFYDNKLILPWNAPLYEDIYAQGRFNYTLKEKKIKGDAFSRTSYSGVHLNTSYRFVSSIEPENFIRMSVYHNHILRHHIGEEQKLFTPVYNIDYYRPDPEHRMNGAICFVKWSEEQYTQFQTSSMEERYEFIMATKIAEFPMDRYNSYYAEHIDVPDEEDLNQQKRYYATSYIVEHNTDGSISYHCWLWLTGIVGTNSPMDIPYPIASENFVYYPKDHIHHPEYFQQPNNNETVVDTYIDSKEIEVTDEILFPDPGPVKITLNCPSVPKNSFKIYESNYEFKVQHPYYLLPYGRKKPLFAWSLNPKFFVFTDKNKIDKLILPIHISSTTIPLKFTEKNEFKEDRDYQLVFNGKAYIFRYRKYTVYGNNETTISKDYHISARIRKNEPFTTEEIIQFLENPPNNIINDIVLKSKDGNPVVYYALLI